MTQKARPVLLAGLCLLAGIACAPATPPKALPVNPPPTADQSASDDNDSDTTFDNLEIVDASLKGKLGVLRVGSQIAENNNLLTVFAGFKNKTGRHLALEVMTIYKDKTGTALNNASWIPLTLKPHEEHDYRSSSITVQATDFLIRVRLAQGPAHK